MHITEISKSRLNDRMSMLLDPMTATSSSREVFGVQDKRGRVEVDLHTGLE